MNVAVLIKQTPDTAELPKVTVAEAKSGDVQGDNGHQSLG